MPSDADESNVSEMRLCELAEASHGSVRLRNALTSAAASDSLPFSTVAEYLACPAPIVTLRRHVRNLGARTALELDRMVRGYALR